MDINRSILDGMLLPCGPSIESFVPNFGPIDQFRRRSCITRMR